MSAVSRGWRTWCDAFVPPNVQSDVDKERRARFIVAICIILLPLIALRAVTLYVAGMRGQSVAVVSVLGACLAAPWALRRTGSLVLSGNIVVAAIFVTGMAMSFQRGGIGAPMVIGLGAIPLLAIFVAGTRSGIVWTALVMLLVIALGAYEYGLGQPLPDRLTGAARLRVELVGALLFPLLILALGLAYEWTKNSALEARARAERKRLQAEEASRMLQADRMASVGQIAAGVAHEINNPLAYIAGNLDYIERELDLILCDLMMPDVTGAELYERVASWGRGIERQIVFITGGVFTEQMRLFLEQVPNLSVEKPIRAITWTRFWLEGARRSHGPALAAVAVVRSA